MKFPKRLFLFAGVCVALAIFASVLFTQYSQKTKRRLDSIEAQVQELKEQLAALQQDQRAAAATALVVPRDKSVDAAAPLRFEVASAQERLAALERWQLAVSNEMASARGANIPFVYADSTRRTDYAFSGYQTAQSALQSVLWAITKSDAKTFLQSVTGTMGDVFAKQFADLPPDVMPGGFRNGAMFKANGFRVVQETPLAEDEMRLKVFLEGSRTMIQPVFKRVGGEWKWERNE